MNNTRSVVVVGHFPPPVHGMAMTTQAFSDILEQEYDRVLRVRTTADPGIGGFRYHLQRLHRTVAAGARLTRSRREANLMYASCDAGAGMVYTLTAVLAARLLRYRIFIHHHSYAYVNDRLLRLQILFWVGGRAHHLVYCRRMAEDMAARYPRHPHIEVAPAMFVVKPPSGLPPARVNDRSDSIVIGHLSNLSQEKGLDRVFDTLMHLRRSGVNVHLLLAGPTASPADEALMRSRLRAASGAATYLGPVHGRDKDEFFDRIDVFLFPTRYRHESFGLVVAEAAIRGVPPIAFRAGCLTPEFVGNEEGTGVVLEHTEDFVSVASGRIAHWAEDRASLAAASAACQKRMVDSHSTALSEVIALVRGMDVAPRG